MRDLLEEFYPNCAKGMQYALDVVSGKILAGEYIICACQRFLDDIENPKYTFHPERAEKFLRIVQKFEHVIGTWDTKNISYLPWQCWVWMNIMGLYSNETGHRKYRTVHLEIPRGHGKSTMSSQAALFFLACDDETQGNQVSCCATRKEQARIVLDSARAMARKNASFLKSKGVEVLAHKIVKEDTFSHIVAKSSDSNGLDGLADILAILDELHAMKKEVFDVIDSGMSKRRDSLLLCITTAGSDVDSVGYSQSVYARKVAMGDVDDPTFFSAVYTIDEGDDPFIEETWRKANPSYGYSVDPVNFAAKAKKAQENPQDKANFLIKHLNMWQSEAKAYFSIAKWEEGADPSLKLEDFKGQRCFVGIDLASKIDLTALVYVFRKDGTYYIFEDVYIPEKTVEAMKSSLYEESIGKGFLIKTPGEAIHYPKLQEDLLARARQFRIVGAMYDPWAATEFSQRMTQERIEMVEYRMTTANLSEPTKQLEALLRQGKIKHRGSPLFRWCLSNVVCKEDAAGNIYPRKSHDNLKIDPAVALIMALSGWIQLAQDESVYSQRGIRVL